MKPLKRLHAFNKNKAQLNRPACMHLYTVFYSYFRNGVLSVKSLMKNHINPMYS